MTEYVTLWIISADLYVEMCNLCSNIYEGIIKTQTERFQFSMFYKTNDM